MTKPVPLLILSDAPSCTSGLGRITRDLATRIATDMQDEFRVATLGYGGAGNSSFPFFQYHIHEMKDWVIPDLPIIWNDFTQGDDRGILLAIWDASRVLWLSVPEACPIPALKSWLKTAKMRKWTYSPVDAEGVGGKLSFLLQQSLKGFERVLNYSKWSAGVTGYPDHLPHGLDTNVFRPHPRNECRKELRENGWKDLHSTSFMVGIVATNQKRKDWALGMKTCRILLDRGLDVRVWAHTDHLTREWDFAQLVTDFSLQGRVVITMSNYSDTQMARMYSACDVTLGIGLGEGFGYPLAESIACGTPALHGAYGGGAEVVPQWMQIEPIGWRYEGGFCMKRPVFDPVDWAGKAQPPPKHYESLRKPTSLSEALDWQNLWPRWREWLRRGIEK